MKERAKSFSANKPGRPMKVLFISANTEQINMVTLPLGLACVAAAAKQAGHDVLLLDLLAAENSKDLIRKAIDSLNPDIIGISVRNIDDQQINNNRFLLEPVKELVRFCKGISAAPIILGGAGYSIFPASSLAYLEADAGICGEGETAFLSLLARMEQHADWPGIPGLFLPGRDLPASASAGELDRLPLPGSDIWSPKIQTDQKQDIWMPVQSRRGCPLACSYCSTPAIEGRITRKRSPTAIVEWITHWLDRGFSNFFFVDNTFNIPSSYARELCRAIISNIGPRLNWRSIIYPHLVDRELVELMAAAGCRQVSFGFESGSEKILKNMNKKFTPQGVREISEMFAAAGIARMGFLLLGGPGETRETVRQSLEFADSLALEMMKVTHGIRIYPRTRLAATALAENQISPDDDLLLPRHYLSRDVRGWIEEILDRWLAQRPNWIR